MALNDLFVWFAYVIMLLYLRMAYVWFNAFLGRKKEAIYLHMAYVWFNPQGITFSILFPF